VVRREFATLNTQTSRSFEIADCDLSNSTRLGYTSADATSEANRQVVSGVLENSWGLEGWQHPSHQAAQAQRAAQSV
jgi:hypothetical protein